MIELACPSCGRGGQVPREKLYTRLVCRKCHVVFHMDPSGRPVVGEPIIASKDPTRRGKEKEGDHHTVFESIHLPTLDDLTSLKDNFSDGSLPVKPVLGVLGGVVLLWLAFSLISRPAEAVADRAREAMQALANDDLGRLKSFASESTRDDLVRWYDVAHSRLESSRNAWATKATTVQVVVIEENRPDSKGEVEAFIVPSETETQTASVLPSGNSKPGTKSAANNGPLGFHLHWVWSGSHWWLDGTQMKASVAASLGTP